MKDYASRCFKIINSQYLKFISEKEKEKKKQKMHIRIYVRRLENFLQQRFKQLNLSLYVNRRLNYIHIGIEISLLMTSLSLEPVAAIKNFEEEKRDLRFCFHIFEFPRLIHTTRWKYDYIISERKETL